MLSTQPMKTKPKLILASTSPRRADLLKSAGLTFTVIPPSADEIRHIHEPPVSYALRTAREKAESLGTQPGTIILGADTLVVANGQIFGKPMDADNAKAMLRLLSGKRHEVITGIYLRSAEKTVSFHITTAVWFRPLSESEIAAYVATGDSFDKAGAYAIQNNAAGLVQRIEGSYSNVVGLPLDEVIEALETF